MDDMIGEFIRYVCDFAEGGEIDIMGMGGLNPQALKLIICGIS
jgi:hypothetical protein